MRKWFLPSLIGLFMLLSVVTLTSIAPDLAGRQIIFFLVGAAVFFVTAQISFETWLHYRVPVYLAACTLLIVPLFLDPTKGTARWIPVGEWFSIQPSQLAIPLVSLVLINLVSHHQMTLARTGLFFLWLLPPAVLIMIEPDLGTTLVYLFVLGTLLLMAETSWKILGSLLLATVAVALLGWMVLLQPYQKARITSFLSTNADQDGSNYNAEQALIAVGSGGVFGRGLGEGIQSHLQFLPEKHTDFIFASLAEEYGFIGSLVVFGLLATLIGYLFFMSQHVADLSGQLFLVIAGLLFFIQSSVNINMNIGLLPITGITLPLISYGGSSIIAICFILGMTQAIIQVGHSNEGLHIA